MLEVILASRRRVPVRGAADHLAEHDPAGALADGGHRGPALEHRLVGRHGDVVEVVVDPERVEPELLRQHRHLDRLRPLGLRVLDRGQLHLPTLRDEHTERERHATAPSSVASACRSRPLCRHRRALPRARWRARPRGRVGAATTDHHDHSTTTTAPTDDRRPRRPTTTDRRSPEPVVVGGAAAAGSTARPSPCPSTTRTRRPHDRPGPASRRPAPADPASGSAPCS